MKISIKTEFFLICCLSFSLLIIAFLAGELRILSIILALPFILLIPGYTLVSLMYPGSEDLGGPERLALSFGLSIIIVPFIGLALNYTSWGIKLFPIMISITFLNMAIFALGWYRRTKLPEDKRFTLSFQLKTNFNELLNTEKIIKLTFFVSILFTLGTLGYVLASPVKGETFTEFYILGRDGQAAGYPKELTVGGQGQVIVGVVNNEHQLINYRLEVRSNNQLIREIVPITLKHGDKWEKPVIFKLNNPGKNVKIEFLLFRESDTKPYRELYLWMDVVKND